MAVAQYLGFQFLPEDRPALVAALAAHPDASPLDAESGQARFRVVAAHGTCTVEMDDESGTVVLVPGEGEAAAALATDLLSEHGAVFATCC